jgi:DNA-binding PucR family transcriptional regulator
VKCRASGIALISVQYPAKPHKHLEKKEPALSKTQLNHHNPTAFLQLVHKKLLSHICSAYWHSVHHNISYLSWQSLEIADTSKDDQKTNTRGKLHLRRPKQLCRLTDHVKNTVNSKPHSIYGYKSYQSTANETNNLGYP